LTNRLPTLGLWLYWLPMEGALDQCVVAGGTEQ
jgi:hypothetical protein